MQHITDLYQWQLETISKYNNVEFKVCFTGQEQQGYKVVDGLDAHFEYANGSFGIETYKL